MFKIITLGNGAEKGGIRIQIWMKVPREVPTNLWRVSFQSWFTSKQINGRKFTPVNRVQGKPFTRQQAGREKHF